MSNAPILLSAIHGNDGSRNVGAYQSGNAVTDQFNAEHGFQQLNVAWCYDNLIAVDKIDATTATFSQHWANAPLADRFAVGEIINLHWDEDKAVEKITKGVKVTSIVGNVMMVDTRAATGDVFAWVPGVTNRVTLSHLTGRAYDRMDLEKFKTDLSDRSKYPLGSIVMIDREGVTWRKLAPENSGLLVDARGSFVDLMNLAKRTRPDCKFGFYGMQNVLPFYGFRNAYRERRDLPGDSIYEDSIRRNAYLAPIMEVSDYIFPNFYLQNESDILTAPNEPVKTRPFDDVMIDWIGHSMMVMQRAFPTVQVVPLLWHQNYSDLMAIRKRYPTCANADFVWTPELLTEMYLSGPLWKRILGLLAIGGVVTNYTSPDRSKDNFLMPSSFIADWGEGDFIPFGNSPWWLETLKFFEEIAMAIPPAIQQAIDAMQAAEDAENAAVAVQEAATADRAAKKAALLSAVETQWPS